MFVYEYSVIVYGHAQKMFHKIQAVINIIDMTSDYVYSKYIDIAKIHKSIIPNSRIKLITKQINFFDNYTIK